MALKIGIYPGTFDPITRGHIDIIIRASVLVDHLIVAVAENIRKKLLFDWHDRIDLVQRSLQNLPNISVEGFSGMLVNYAHKQGAHVIFRGIRNVSDFEAEWRMAKLNYSMGPSIETAMLIPTESYECVSSGMVKEMADLGGDIKPFVSDAVYMALLNKFGKNGAPERD
jgi:pantetheine-phosphate adenylyltransferase